MKPYRIAKHRFARSALVGTLVLVALCAHTAGAPPAQAMDRARVEPDIELEYRVRGAGEPVVLAHAGLFADWFQPLLEEPALATRYRVLSYDAASNTSRVALEPITGRTHQLRVHMSASGHPIVGDTLYGGNADGGAARLLLHAHTLEFRHPVSGEILSLVSELPF